MPLPDLLRRARGSVAVPLTAATLLVLAAAATAQTSSPPPLRIDPLEGEFIANSRTNVRQQPSGQAQRVGRIESGAKVRVTGKVADAPWYAVVQADGKPGFVAAEQLRPTAAPVATPVATPAAVAAPVAAATAAPSAASDAALREQLAKIEASLADINRQLPNAKELEALSAAVKGLLEREEKRLAEAPPAPAEPKPAPAEGPTIAERVATLQDQIAEQIREQRAEFGRLGERLDSVESSVQPLIDWTKEWTDRAKPAADSAQGWLSSTYATVRDWVIGWIPWWNQPAG